MPSIRSWLKTRSSSRGGAAFLGVLLLVPVLPAAPARAAVSACSGLDAALAAGARALSGPDAPGGTGAFAAYLAAVQAAAGERAALPGLAALTAGEPVPPAAAGAAACVLDGYLLARYGDAMVRDLRTMVGFRTFAVEGRENWDAPEFLRQRDWLAARAAALGLAFRDYDGRVGEITLAPHRDPKPVLAVLTHGDVEGVEGQEWSSPPWEGRLAGDRIVGRGTEDDKGPIVAALYSLAALRDSGWPLGMTVKLLVANGEESSWQEIPYYLERAPMPDMTFGVDASYPVTHAQKGYGVLTFQTGPPPGEPAAGRWRVVRLAGGSGLSIIPERGEALLAPLGGDPGDPEKHLAELAGAAERWAERHSPAAPAAPAALSVTREGDLLKVSALGKGGHSSQPESGHNALGDLAAFLASLPLQQDAWGALATFIGQSVGTETDGRSLGIAHQDEVMGALTSSLAFFEEAEGKPQARINIRVPRGITLADMEARLAARAGAFSAKAGVPVTVKAELLSQPHIAPVEGKLVSTLLRTWEEVTGAPGKPVAIGGGTQARLFAGGVDFGPASAMERYRGHGPDEYMTVAELHRAAELTLRAIWNLTR